jgi:hypothetical protein
LLGSLQWDDAECFLGGVVEQANLRDPDLVIDPELSESDGSKPPEIEKLDSEPLSRDR